MDNLVIMDEKQLERLVGKTQWKKMLLIGITSSLLSIDLFIILYDLTWIIDDLTIYGLVFLTSLILVWDVLSIIIHYKKRQEALLNLLERSTIIKEKQPIAKEIKQSVKTVWKIKWKNLIIFLFVIGISLLIYFGIFGGGW